MILRGGTSRFVNPTRAQPRVIESRAKGRPIRVSQRLGRAQTITQQDAKNFLQTFGMSASDHDVLRWQDLPAHRLHNLDQRPQTESWELSQGGGNRKVAAGPVASDAASLASGSLEQRLMLGIADLLRAARQSENSSEAFEVWLKTYDFQDLWPALRTDAKQKAVLILRVICGKFWRCTGIALESDTLPRSQQFAFARLEFDADRVRVVSVWDNFGTGCYSSRLADTIRANPSLQVGDDVVVRHATSAKKPRAPRLNQPRSEGVDNAFLMQSLSSSEGFSARLLTREEEHALGVQIQRALNFEGPAFRNHPDLVAGARAVHTFMLHNHRLVRSEIRKMFPTLRHEWEDLFSEGMLGLRAAALRFDPTLGMKFSTYATWWIRQTLLRYLQNNGRTIRIPLHMHEKINKVRRVISHFVDKHGFEPTNEQLIERMGRSPGQVKKLRKMRNMLMPLISLSEKRKGDSNVRLEDTLEDEDAVLPERQVIQADLSASLLRCLARLPERDQEILRLHRGLLGNDPHSLGEIAAMMGVSRERVRQLEIRARQRLKEEIRHYHDTDMEFFEDD